MVRYPGFSANLAMLFQDEASVVLGSFFGAVSLLIVRFSSKKNLDTFKSHFFLVVECSGIVDWCSWVVEFSNHSGFWQWPLEQTKTKENHGFGEFPTFMSR